MGMTDKGKETMGIGKEISDSVYYVNAVVIPVTGDLYLIGQHSLTLVG